MIFQVIISTFHSISALFFIIISKLLSKFNTLEKYIKYLLENTTIMDELPSYLKEKYHLCSLQEAYQYIHFPKNKEELKEVLEKVGK